MTSSYDKYNNTVNYLYGLQKHGIKLGLNNTKKLMEVLGAPHKAFNAIHIVGTNGKGSTASAIASILKEAGFKTGLFTSPHLVSFTERIRVNDQRISEEDVINLAEDIRNSYSDSDIKPTFFEFITAMAFHYFASRNVDWAVIETGMGGRLDATNVLEPAISIVTNVSLDHSEFLGETIQDIAKEKAGIIKPGVPVITASLIPEVIQLLSDTASNQSSEINIYGRDFSGELLSMDDRSLKCNYNGDNSFKELYIPLAGYHQLYNGCVAVKACEILQKKGISIKNESIIYGLKNMRIEGRMEWVSDSPPILLDSAHNPVAARSLAKSIKELHPHKKIILIAGIMDDKDIKDILEPLVGISSSAILTKASYERAAPLEKMEKIFCEIQDSGIIADSVSLKVLKTVKDAINYATSICTDDSLILVTGSFYTTGEAKEHLGSIGILSNLREKF